MIRLFFAIATLLTLPGLAAAQDFERRSGVILRTSGVVVATPNLVRVSVGVVTRATTAPEALRQNKPAANEVIAIAKQFGVQSADVRTTEVTLIPIYTPHAPGARQPAKIESYTASVTLTVLLRDISRIGEFIDAAAKGGANKIDQISFDVDNRLGLLDEARQLAAKTARERAELYANALNVRIGALIRISETSNELGESRIDLPTRRAPRVGPEPAQPLTVEPGEIRVTATVETIWRIAD